MVSSFLWKHVVLFSCRKYVIKRMLKSDGQQLNHLLSRKRTRRKALGIQVLAWERHKNMARLNRTPTLIRDNWISDDNTEINIDHKCLFTSVLSLGI